MSGRQSVSAGKMLAGKMFCRENVLPGKCWPGNDGRENVVPGKCTCREMMAGKRWPGNDCREMIAGKQPTIVEKYKLNG